MARRGALKRLWKGKGYVGVTAIAFLTSRIRSPSRAFSFLHRSHFSRCSMSAARWGWEISSKTSRSKVVAQEVQPPVARLGRDPPRLPPSLAISASQALEKILGLFPRPLAYSLAPCATHSHTPSPPWLRGVLTTSHFSISPQRLQGRLHQWGLLLGSKPCLQVLPFPLPSHKSLWLPWHKSSGLRLLRPLAIPR